MAKIKNLTRSIYGIIGIAGIMSILWALFNLSTFLSMDKWVIVLNILANISMINWGIVAVTGYRNKDLFGLLKM